MMRKDRIPAFGTLLLCLFLSIPALAIPIDVGVTLRADWDFTGDTLPPPYTNGGASMSVTGVDDGEGFSYSFHDTVGTLLASGSTPGLMAGTSGVGFGLPFLAPFTGTAGYLLLTGFGGPFEIINPKVQLMWVSGSTILRTANQPVTLYQVASSASVPEPGTLGLLGGGVLLLASRRRRGGAE